MIIVIFILKSIILRVNCVPFRRDNRGDILPSAALIGVHLQVVMVVLPFRAERLRSVWDDWTGKDVGNMQAFQGM